MRPIDLLGIELCDHCQQYVEAGATSFSKGVMRSYYCEHSMCASHVVDSDSGKLIAVSATSDPCTTIDWKQCRLNPANQAGA